MGNIEGEKGGKGSREVLMEGESEWKEGAKEAEELSGRRCPPTTRLSSLGCHLSIF